MSDKEAIGAVIDEMYAMISGPAGPRVFDVTSVVRGWNGQNGAAQLFKLRATPTTRNGVGKNTTIRALEFAGTDSDPRLEVQY